MTEDAAPATGRPAAAAAAAAVGKREADAAAGPAAAAAAASEQWLHGRCDREGHRSPEEGTAVHV